MTFKEGTHGITNRNKGPDGTKRNEACPRGKGVRSFLEVTVDLGLSPSWRRDSVCLSESRGSRGLDQT